MGRISRVSEVSGVIEGVKNVYTSSMLDFSMIAFLIVF